MSSCRATNANRTHGVPFLRVVDTATERAERPSVTVYVHDHPDLWPWLEVIDAAHRQILAYITRRERDGDGFPR